MFIDADPSANGIRVFASSDITRGICAACSLFPLLPLPSPNRITVLNLTYFFQARPDKDIIIFISVGAIATGSERVTAGLSAETAPSLKPKPSHTRGKNHATVDPFGF
jgi:hypothetical protein